MSDPIRPEVHAFFDGATNTVSYVVRDPAGSSVAIVDSVLDFDYASGRTDTTSAQAIADFVTERGWSVEWLLETHVHADHLSAAPWLQERLGGRIGIGERITQVQDTFGRIFNEGTRFARDGSQFDRLFGEGDRFAVGAIEARVLHTPGHTPACLTYVIGDAAFVGDTLFMPDFGTARCDFPGGSSETLYASIQKILALPPETRVFVGHDYLPPGGRQDYRWETTVAQQRDANIHIGGDRTREDFVALRDKRDAGLAAPRLIIPALQVNMRAGHLPEPDDDGNRYLKVPLNRL